MSGPENLKGVDYQISFSLYSLLRELTVDGAALAEVQFESLSENEEDLNFTYKNGTSEFIQIKKRMEGYQWIASDISPILKTFSAKDQRNRRFRFVTDAPGNKDVRDLRLAVDDPGLATRELLLKFASKNLKLSVLEKLIRKVTLQTRAFTSGNDDDPARELRKEINRILCGPPFKLSQPPSIVTPLLWRLIFDHARAAHRISIPELLREFETAGVSRISSPLHNVPAVEDFRGRTEELNALRQIIEDSPWIIVRGISGIGKSALVARLAGLLVSEGQRVLWIKVSPVTTIPELLAAVQRLLGENNDGDAFRGKLHCFKFPESHRGSREARNESGLAVS